MPFDEQPSIEISALGPVDETEDYAVLIGSEALIPKLARRMSAPAFLNPTLHQLSQRLLEVKEEASTQQLVSQQSIKRLNVVRSDLKDTLHACHKTMEMSGKCLTNFFRSIPSTKLSKEIGERFKHFDKDKNGTLDKDEVRGGMAEMGQRPDDEELNTFFAACDTDGNGKIDRGEFEAMIRIKLGLENLKDIVQVAHFARESSKERRRVTKPGWASQIPPLRRRGSCPDVIIARKQLPPLKPSASRARRGSLSAEDRMMLAKPSVLIGQSVGRTSNARSPPPESSERVSRKPSLQALHRRPSSPEEAPRTESRLDRIRARRADNVRASS